MTGLNESPPVCRPAGQSLKPATGAKAIAPLRFQWRIIMTCKGGKVNDLRHLGADSSLPSINPLPAKEDECK
jgi:hypothetical protein